MLPLISIHPAVYCFNVDNNSAAAFLIPWQLSLNLPNCLLVWSSYVFMAAPSFIHFYPFTIEGMSSCIFLCKWYTKMCFYFCNRSFQTLLFHWIFKKMLPLLSFEGGFHKPYDEMFSVDLTNKEKISIWTQYLPKFKVCGLSLPWNLSTRVMTILFSNIWLESGWYIQLLDQFSRPGSFYLIQLC